MEKDVKETASHLLTAPCQTFFINCSALNHTTEGTVQIRGNEKKKKNHLMHISLQTERWEFLVHWPCPLFMSCLHPYTTQAALNEVVDNRTSWSYTNK